MADPGAVVAALRRRGLTIATGESLTAGLVAATLADVPGCSDVLRGGVVAYQVDLKTRLLSVTADDLAHGVVSAPVAAAMALGAAQRLSADVGVGTTGVAGPEPHDGAAVGTAWIAVSVAGRVTTRQLAIDGDRAAVRHGCVAACWPLLLAALEESDAAGTPAGARE